MDELFEEPGRGEDSPGRNTPEFTVSELSGEVKRAIEGGFSQVRVRGEIGRVMRAGSGHVYFDLKDDRAVLSAVAWKGQAARLSTRPEEGLEVVATGRLTTFPGQSKYQMIVEDLAPAGIGALMAMLEKRRRALEAEGLFAAERKRPLPYLPEVIGVVTSPTGAVIRDILHRLRDRFPRKVLIWPVTVQGNRCAPEVARAIAGFNALQPGGSLPRPDVLIVARGGGSVEDLWGFNEEIVVRAAAASAIPLISAVGHETDTTLIDHAADRRAPTPTAAAEMAVPVRSDLLAQIDATGARLTRAGAQTVSLRQQRLRDLARALPRPVSLAETARQRLDLATERLPRALAGLVRSRRAELARAAAALSPRRLDDRLQVAAERHAGLARRLDRAAAALIRTDTERLSRAGARLPQALAGQIERQRAQFHRRADRLSPRPLRADIARGRDALARTGPRLPRAVLALLRDRAARLAALDRVRQSFDHTAVLARGFVLVRDADGHLVTSRAAATALPRLSLGFVDGPLDVVPETGPARPSASPRKRGRRPAQGSLFDE